MAIVDTIDSNEVRLHIAQEQSFEVLPAAPVFIEAEVNEYSDFGGTVSKVARRPINPDRQKRKSILTGVEASGAVTSDLTEQNVQSFLEGGFFAERRTKTKFTETTVVGSAGNDFQAASGLDAFSANDLVFAAGFDEIDNSGVFLVSSASATSLVVSGGTLGDETVVARTELTKVGARSAAGEITVTTSAGYPTLVSTAFDFTTLGLIPGEWIYVGGLETANKFVNASNNGFKRVHKVTANVLTLDKSVGTMVSETQTGLLIDIYVGSVLKNEIDASLRKKKYYRLQRTLGAPDDSNPTELQSEYVSGALLNEVNINIPTKDKASVELSFMGANSTTRTATEGLLSKQAGASEIKPFDTEAFNTSKDIVRMKVAQVSKTEEDSDGAFAFVTEASVKINNNASRNEAIGSVGAIGMVAGVFEVTGELKAYFKDVEAMHMVNCNQDVTFDAILAVDHTAIVIDLPLITLSDGKASAEQDQSIMLDLTYDASTAVSVNNDTDYTALMVFFDYVPYIAAGC